MDDREPGELRCEDVFPDEDTTSQTEAAQDKEKASETEGEKSNHRWSEPAARHKKCIAPLANGGLRHPYYGVSQETIEALQIEAPIMTRLFARNLGYGIDEAKLHEVFSMSGWVVQATLLRRHDGQSRGLAVVEYAHPLEALQSRVMFRHAKLHTIPMIITQRVTNKLGLPPTIPGWNL